MKIVPNTKKLILRSIDNCKYYKCVNPQLKDFQLGKEFASSLGIDSIMELVQFYKLNNTFSSFNGFYTFNLGGSDNIMSNIRNTLENIIGRDNIIEIKGKFNNIEFYINPTDIIIIK